MSRQVYTNTVRARTQRSQGIANSSDYYPATNPGISSSSLNNYYSHTTPCVSSVGGSASPSRPTGQEIRNARLQKFSAVYENDKQAHIKKEEERKRKKLLEKLERYKGVGELGNRVSDESVTEDEKYDGFWRSRDSYQYKHDAAANSALEENLKREKEIRERKITESMKKLSFKTVTSQGTASSQAKPEPAQKLGGNSFQRVRGEHPLLAKLDSTKNKSDN